MWPAKLSISAKSGEAINTVYSADRSRMLSMSCSRTSASSAKGLIEDNQAGTISERGRERRLEARA